MKKILQAFDSASTKKSVAGSDDMKKFVSIVKGLPVKPINESVITSFEENTIGGDVNEFLIHADNINDMVMAEIDKIKINADPELLKELMDKFNSFMTAYHAVGKEILEPDLFKDDIQTEGAKEELEKLEKHPAAKDPKIAAAIDDAKDKEETKEESIEDTLSSSFKDYFNLAEAKKKISAKDDPCWKGYKMVGTKNKGGKEVPNCVPGKKGD